MPATAACPGQNRRRTSGRTPATPLCRLSGSSCGAHRGLAVSLNVSDSARLGSGRLVAVPDITPEAPATVRTAPEYEERLVVGRYDRPGRTARDRAGDVRLGDGPVMMHLHVHRSEDERLGE